jgi:GT2 family glycosyltransferase/SAM-dependent methyltransferase
VTPAVSVVIPCFNLGAYLDEAVRSVLGQTYDDFEIVIVDDGSDDEATRLMLATYERPNTRILRTPNQGVSRARNAGLAEARGEYVSFLDPDDVLAPRFLERTIAALEADEALTFASCWLTGFGEREFQWEPTDCGFPWLLAEDTVCTAAPTRSEALRAVGGFDPAPEVDGYEDWELAVRLVDAGYRGRIIEEPLFRYRIRPGSKSSARTRPDNHARVFEYMLEKHGETYRRHFEGVLAAIATRTEALEAQLGEDVPPRPQVDRDDWQAAILACENHRRGLEEQLESRSRPPARDEPPAFEWGSLRRLEPVSRVWGLDRGRPIDRFYIERFLEREAGAISGDVLEVKDPGCTKAFGERARTYTAVDIAEGNEDATLFADLAGAGALTAERFDCFVITQTIHIIYELSEVVRNVHRCLRPGGVALATLPCVSRIDYESGVDGDFWRFTAASAKRLFEAEFGSGEVQVESFGNVLACTAFLQGLAVEDLDRTELERHDPYFPLLLGVRARKAGQRGEVATASVEGHLDEATCRAISGWAWEPAAPERRHRVELTSGGAPLARAWCDEPRADLAEGLKGNGRVAFRVAPPDSIHDTAEAEVRAMVGEQELVGSPATVRCVCGRAGVERDGPGAGLQGADLDSPGAGQRLSYPEAEIVGWAVGEAAPVERVELLHGGEVFRTVPVDRPRPDLEDAFPGVEWAGRAGFAAPVMLAGTGGEVDLEVRAVLADGRRARVARVTAAAADPAPLPVVAVLAEAPVRRSAPGPLAQTTPLNRILLARGDGATLHPGFEVMAGGWSAALGGAKNAVVWLGSGDESLRPDFLDRALRRLSDDPAISFVSAVESGSSRRLASVLGGGALGQAAVFRASAARLVGGFDEALATPAGAAWDLAIRLAEAGHGWDELDACLPESGTTVAAAAGEHDTRRIYRKHARLFEASLAEVLLERERTIGGLLRSNHVAERTLESDLRRRLRGRRRERDRLASKLRRADAGDRADAWGDLRRLEPLSPLWGSERGLAVDRFYVERFIESCAADVRGVVLSCPDAVYAERYGGERVERCDVFDSDPANPEATLVAGEEDNASPVPEAVYDCVLLAHILQHTFAVEGALAEFGRVVKPGGTLIVTVPAVARIDAGYGVDQDHWRFTASGMRALIERALPGAEAEVSALGNARAVAGFLAGVAAEEIGAEELAASDPARPLVVTARVVAVGS